MGLYQNITTWDNENNSKSLLSSDGDNSLLRLFGQQDRVDAGNNSSSGNGDIRHELVDLMMTVLVVR